MGLVPALFLQVWHSVCHVKSGQPARNILPSIVLHPPTALGALKESR